MRKSDKINGKKSITYPKLQKLLDQSSRLWTIPKVYSKNLSNYFCAKTTIVPDVVLVNKVEFGELHTFKRL